tara:strand:- start:19 stop:183 length:165 start_codon:yes stop_codon:yes gene_type:complete
MEKFLIFALGIVIFAVTKWYRGRDKPLDTDLFDSPEKREKRRKLKRFFFDPDHT